MKPADLAARLKEEGVWLLPQPGRRLRAVTHYGITAEDIESTLGAFRRVMAGA
jgi:threonine aldolase